MTADDAAQDHAARANAARLRPVFLVILALWLAFPFLVNGNLAQDAVPIVVAGELVRDHPDAIYAANARDLYDLPPAFAARSCEISPPGTDCRNLNVPFVSPPQALPIAFVLSRAGPSAAILLMRLVAGASLAAGMWLLWKRLATRTPRAPAALVASALLLTPFTMVPIPLGQTSPLLFLSACVGVDAGRRRQVWAALVAALWVATVSLKLFPAALVLVLIWQRQWRVLAWAAGFGAALTALALALAPAQVFTDFRVASDALSAYSNANPYNGSVAAVVAAGAPVLASGAGAVVVLAARVGLVGALAWRLRRAEDDVQWSWAWLAVLVFVPLVWWHYLWLAVAAVGIALASRPRLDDRTVLVLPALAALTIPITIPNGQGGAVPVLQLGFLVGAVVLAALLAAPRAGARHVPGAPAPAGAE